MLSLNGASVIQPLLGGETRRQWSSKRGAQSVESFPRVRNGADKSEPASITFQRQAVGGCAVEFKLE